MQKSFKGKFTTNLKLHLKKEHSEEYRLVDVEEKKKREETVRRLGKNKVKDSSSLFTPMYFTKYCKSKEGI